MQANPIKIGERFGNLVVIERGPALRSGARKWRCECDCGGERVAASYNLRRGKTKSCGCLNLGNKRQAQLPPAKPPLTFTRRAVVRKPPSEWKGVTGGGRPVAIGERFGRQIAIEVGPSRKQGRMFLCRCDCGNEHYVFAKVLRFGKSLSCGCLQKEKRGSAQRTHGEGYKKTAEYKTWVGLKSRCLNPKNNRYNLYGGRGITVCDRWLSNFENFLSDMGRKPSPAHSIDRIDNDGNYEPENCRWATRSVQMQNRRPFQKRSATL